MYLLDMYHIRVAYECQAQTLKSSVYVLQPLNFPASSSCYLVPKSLRTFSLHTLFSTGEHAQICLEWDIIEKSGTVALAVR